MSKKQIMFYATAHDLGSVLSSLESANPLQYVTGGMSTSNQPQVHRSCAEIPNFGQAIHPTAIANPYYLMSFQGTPIHAEEIPQKMGGILFAFDQLKNPDSVALHPGGSFGSAVILYGAVGTISKSVLSNSLYKLIAGAIRKKFSKQSEYFVGSEAREAWKSGARLTIGVSSPSEFDLKHKV